MSKRVKSMYFVFFSVIAALVLAGCGSDDSAQPTGAAPAAQEPAAQEPVGSGFTDGVYVAQAADFSERTGWKDVVTLVVEGGEIVDAQWNAAHTGAGTDKLTRSRDGEYGMVENSAAQWPWWEQAEATAAYLLETQDPSTVSADAISGATISVGGFFDLAQEALERGPVGYGDFRDGHYRAEADEFSNSGWKDTVNITVIAGRVVSVNWDAIAEDGGSNKKQRSMDGEYGMYENSAAQWPWWEQAVAAERQLMETQDPGTLNADVVSGASIRLGGFESLVRAALADAGR